MRRKSDRSKSKSSSDKKSPEKTTRRSRRLKRTQSKSPDRNSDGRSESELDDKNQPDVATAPSSSATLETITEESVIPKKDGVTNSNSEDETKESVWQVQSTESSDAGEIQKLKICLKRPSSTPERSDKSPRSHRDIQSCSSQDSSDEKRFKKSKKPEAIVEDSEKVVASPVMEKDPDVAKIDPIICNDDKTEHTIENINDNLKITETQENSEGNTLSETSENVKMESTTVTEKNQEVSTDDPPKKDSAEISTKSEENLSVEATESKIDTMKEDPKPECEQDDSKIDNQPEATIEANSSDVNETEPMTVQPDKEGEENPCASENNEHASENSKKEDEISAEQTVTGAEQSQESAITDTNVNNGPDECTKDHRRKSDASELTKNSSPNSDTSSDEERSETRRGYSREKKRKMSSDSKNSRMSGKDSEKNYHSDSRRRSQVKNVSRSHTPEKQNTSDKKISDNEKSEKENKFEKANEKCLTTQISESEKLPRKRRWGSKKNSTSEKKPILAISTDSLKNLISDVKPLSVNDVQLEDTVERKDKNVKKNDNSPDTYEEKIEKRKRSTEVDKNTVEHKDERKRHLSESENNEPRTSHRKISIVMDEHERKSPPKSTSSEVLYITNLVRPFTVLQLKGLLQRTGKIIENGFWIDNIKSKCYVHYETEDQAVETRHALHGVRWPVSNPKHLQVEFATVDDMEKCVNNVSAPADIKRPSDRDSIVEAWVRDQNSREDRNKDKGESNRKQIVREWDMGKQDPIDSPEKQTRDEIPNTSRERERDRTGRDQARDNRDTRDRKRRSRSPSPVRKYKKKEEVAPSKRLDDLFRKTKTAPCLYWLPLTPEQIAVKEEMRRQHMAEHERRKEEIRRQEQRDKEREKERIRERERNRARTRDRSDSRQARGGDRYH